MSIGSRRLLAVSHAAVLGVNQEQYRALQERGWHTRLVVPGRWRHEFAEHSFRSEALSGLETALDPHPVALAGRPQRHFYLARPAALIRAEAPGIVFLEEEYFSVPAAQWAMAAARLRIPFGVQAAENLDRPLPELARRIRREVLPRAAFVVARSPKAADLARHFGATGLVEVVPHHVPTWSDPPVDPSREDPKRRPTIGYAGRLVREKGLSDLVAAVKLVGAPVRLLLVGNGPMREELETESGAEIEIWGSWSHDRMAEAYAQMDVLVLPSRRTPTWEEQFGRVLVEAMGRGVPVIGSRTGEIPWVVESTGGGWLFPEGDVTELARLLTQVLGDEAARSARAAAGADAVQRMFSLEAVATQMNDLLENVIAATARGPRRTRPRVRPRTAARR